MRNKYRSGYDTRTKQAELIALDWFLQSLQFSTHIVLIHHYDVDLMFVFGLHAHIEQEDAERNGPMEAWTPVHEIDIGMNKLHQQE